MSLNLIVAHDKNKVIGLNGSIPWKIKGEQQLFKELTMNNIVIMGKNTYDSIGGKLPNRINIVVTSSDIKEETFLFKARSLDEAIRICKQIKGFYNIYIIGGAQIYKKALETLEFDYLYITEINDEFEGDTYFPEVDYSGYSKQVLNNTINEDGYLYTQYLYTKK